MLETRSILPQEYSSEYERLLASLSQASPSEVFGRNAEQNWNGVEYSAFWPEFGSSYNPHEDLLIVGRAPNGGDNPWHFSKLATLDPHELRLKASEKPEALDVWMIRCWQKSKDRKYCSNTAFWRAVKLVVEGLGTGSDYWASRLAWTNLYKIAPATGGNPAGKLRKYQLQHCINLLKLELDGFKPRYVLVVTGDWFMPFIGPFGFTSNLTQSAENPYILRTENRNDQKWVFTVRPERIKSNLFATQVLKALGGE